MVEVQLQTGREKKKFTFFEKYCGHNIVTDGVNTSLPTEVTRQFNSKNWDAGSFCVNGCIPEENLYLVGVVQFRHACDLWKVDHFIELVLQNGSEQYKKRVFCSKCDDPKFRPNHYTSGAEPLQITVLSSDFTILPPQKKPEIKKEEKNADDGSAQKQP